MKNLEYLTTDEHTLFRAGLKINNFERNDNMFNLFDNRDSFNLAYPVERINRWLQNGWIIEIQPKEFTRDDMIKFAHSRAGYNTYSTDLNKWIKENKHVTQHNN